MQQAREQNIVSAAVDAKTRAALKRRAAAADRMVSAEVRRAVRLYLNGDQPFGALGGVSCVRCLKAIEPGTPWELDHKDDGRGWLGPSHRACNRRGGWDR